VFFFQAEDGIRGLIVTGVQTCALPISGLEAGDVGPDAAVRPEGERRVDRDLAVDVDLVRVLEHLGIAAGGGIRQHEEVALGDLRSEERRVGKECRARVSRAGLSEYEVW